MIRIARWRILLVILSVVFGVIFAGPNVLPADVRARLPEFVRDSTINLGLDLRGGVQMMLQVDTDALRRQRLDQIADAMASTLRDAEPRIPANGRGVSQDGTYARIRLNDTADAERALALLREGTDRSADAGAADRAASISFTANGNNVIEARLSGRAISALAREAVGRSIEVLRNRIDPSGVSETTIVREGDDRIVIQAPGESDPAALRSRVGQTALLTFHLLNENVGPEAAQSGRGAAILMPFAPGAGEQ